MKIICISDTHCSLDKITLPEGDLLIHAGDATFKGTIQEIQQFNNSLLKIKDKYKYGIIFVPGNHDWLFERSPFLAKEIMTACTVLIDETIEINGLKIYGSPWQPEFCNWAFNLPRGNELAKKWENIPKDTAILITHTPALGILDRINTGSNVGCDDLFRKIMEISPKAHICGHIHYSYGEKFFNGVYFINASICDEQYYPINKPIILEVE